MSWQMRSAPALRFMAERKAARSSHQPGTENECPLPTAGTAAVQLAGSKPNCLGLRSPRTKRSPPYLALWLCSQAGATIRPVRGKVTVHHHRRGSGATGYLKRGSSRAGVLKGYHSMSLPMGWHVEAPSTKRKRSQNRMWVCGSAILSLVSTNCAKTSSGALPRTRQYGEGVVVT